MAKESSNLFALLIGINYYFENELPDGGCYGHLYGCVRDVSQMETFLRTRLNLTDDSIIKLTSSHGENNTCPGYLLHPSKFVGTEDGRGQSLNPKLMENRCRRPQKAAWSRPILAKE